MANFLNSILVPGGYFQYSVYYSFPSEIMKEEKICKTNLKRAGEEINYTYTPLSIMLRNQDFKWKNHWHLLWGASVWHSFDMARKSEGCVKGEHQQGRSLWYLRWAWRLKPLEGFPLLSFETLSRIEIQLHLKHD